MAPARFPSAVTGLAGVFPPLPTVGSMMPTWLGVGPYADPGNQSVCRYRGEPSQLPSAGHNFWDGYMLALLDAERSDVASLARFAQRIDIAIFYLCVGFDKGDVRDFKPPRARNVVRVSSKRAWYAGVVNSTFNRYRELRSALVYDWTPPLAAEPLVHRAFFSLCDLTPAESQLRELLHKDRPKAFSELASHLDIVAHQLERTVQLASELEVERGDDAPVDGDPNLAAVQAEVLANAGSPMSLKEAATLLGVSRQALHKRIKAGTALGVMRGSTLVVPSIQFVEQDGNCRVVDNLHLVVRLFEEANAGMWSALQYLTDVDPALRRTPLEALKMGEVAQVVAAAGSYLGLDET